MKAIAAKTSIFLFLLYMLWYGATYRNVPLFLYGGAMLVVVTTAIYANHRTLGCLVPPKGILLWLGFGAYSLIIGLVVATDRSLLVSSIERYMAFLVVCWCICVICTEENDIQWLLKCIIIVCHICALYTVFFGKQYGDGVYYISMGPKSNPNSLGILMLYGMFAVLYNKKHKLGEVLGMLVSMLLFFYVVILTGSRKSLISGALLCMVWLIAFVRDTHKIANKREKRLKYALLLIVLVIGWVYFAKHYANTASFTRLQTLFNDGSSFVRMGMYREAVELFKTSKLFGIGFDQFRVLSSFDTYSHSTYAEVLACGGILGCVVFFYPIIQTGIVLVKKLRNSPSYRMGMLLALFLVEIFLGTGMIFMYSFDHLLIWSILHMTAENPELVDRKAHKRGEKLCQKFAPLSGS